MQKARDPILWLGAALVLVVTLHGAVSAGQWIGQPFPGFLLLGNRVVASAGLADWPAVQGGGIFQHELIAVNGLPLESAQQLHDRIASLPVGAPVTYLFRSEESSFERVIPTRTFTGVDYTLLFGTFLLCGLGLTGVALLIRFLRRADPAARGVALSFWLIGMWALTATDLYGPYRLFRAHAFLECLIFAATLHLALVFPFRRGLAVRAPWLIGALYGVAGMLALWNQWGIHDPKTYVLTHRLAVAGFGLAALCLAIAQVWTLLRPPSFEARQRVKVLALGSVAALAPQVLLSLSSALSGGRTPENFMGWSGIFFPLAVGYAVLRSDLLQVDGILRRTVNYALLTGIVAITYTAVILLVEPFVNADGAESRWLSAITLAMVSVIVLLPLRDRVQSGVDRLFFRSHFDFRRTITQSSEQLAAVTDLSIVTRHLETVVRESLHPESISFEVATPGVENLALPAAFPREAEQMARRSSQVIELEEGKLGVTFVGQNRLVAVMELGRPLSGRFYTGDDRRFLGTLANQGSIAIQNSLALLQVEELNVTLERKVEDRTAELAETLRELQTMQRQMVHQEKMASIGQLVAGVAHEMNNPLNFIQGNLYHLREYAETLQLAIERYEAATKETSAAAAKRLAEVRDEMDLDYFLQDLDGLFAGCEEGVRRMTTIVRDLRTFSRTDSDQPVQVDLRKALDATLNLLSGPLTGIDIHRDYHDIPRVECLEGQVDQVFMNLIANAADALGGQGNLWLSVCAEGDCAVVEVRDDGCGIPEENLGRLFEPFFTTKDVGKGTGLGLAISFGVVARHDGQIEAESPQGCGALFRVHLPMQFRGAASKSPSEE